MKKTIKKSSRHQNSSGTGIALLICFVIATVAVAVAIRQLVLERRYFQSLAKSEVTSPKNPLVGVYTATLKNSVVTLDLNLDRSVTLTRDNVSDKLDTKESGSWSGDTNGTVIVSIGDKTTYAFSSQDNMLTLLNPDVKIWGNNKVTFSKKQ